MSKRNAMTKSVDGKFRLSVRVRARLDTWEMAQQVAAYRFGDLTTREPGGDMVPDRKAIREMLSNRKRVVGLVADGILMDGIERAAYVVGDEGLDDLVAAVHARILELWAGEG